LAIHALNDGTSIDRSELIRILRKRNREWGEVRTALRMIQDTGAVEKARAEARSFGDLARRALDTLPDTNARGRLRDLVDFVLSRQS
jgi:geranylgeranyl pyrophosphate synthase